MSKRSIRVVRHRPDFEPNPSFKEMVYQGQIERCIRLGLSYDMYLPKKQVPVSEGLAASLPPYIPAENELFSDTLAEMTPEELDAPARLDTMYGRVLSEEEANQVKQELFPDDNITND